MADEDSVVHCPNLKCGLVFRPDPRIYRDGNKFCPKCGADLEKRPAIFKEDGSYG